MAHINNYFNCKWIKGSNQKTEWLNGYKNKTHIYVANNRLKVRFPGDSQFLCWILKLGSLMWGLKPSQQCANFLGIIVLQFVSCPTTGYGIWFYCDWVPPTISLQLLLCPWMWAILVWWGTASSVNGCSTASCDCGILMGEETTLHMDITGWSTKIRLIIFFLCQRRRSSIQSPKTRSGADCGWDHQLLIAKFKAKLKRVGMT